MQFQVQAPQKAVSSTTRIEAQITTLTSSSSVTDGARTAVSRLDLNLVEEEKISDADWRRRERKRVAIVERAHLRYTEDMFLDAEIFP